MEDVDLRHAKEHLEELIARARRGEDVRISAENGPSIKLVVAKVDGPRNVIFGQWRHLTQMSEERLLAPLDKGELEWLSGERVDS